MRGTGHATLVLTAAMLATGCHEDGTTEPRGESIPAVLNAPTQCLVPASGQASPGLVRSRLASLLLSDDPEHVITPIRSEEALCLSYEDRRWRLRRVMTRRTAE
jgi:hypothetical protein